MAAIAAPVRGSFACAWLLRLRVAPSPARGAFACEWLHRRSGDGSDGGDGGDDADDADDADNPNHSSSYLGDQKSAPLHT